MTLRELLAQIAALTSADEKTLDMIVETEGCDCVGECKGVEVQPYWKDGRHVVFLRNDRDTGR